VGESINREIPAINHQDLPDCRIVVDDAELACVSTLDVAAGTLPFDTSDMSK